MSFPSPRLLLLPLFIAVTPGCATAGAEYDASYPAARYEPLPGGVQSESAGGGRTRRARVRRGQAWGGGPAPQATPVAEAPPAADTLAGTEVGNGAPATLAATPKVEDPEPTPDEVKRLVIYTASFAVIVPDIDDARRDLLTELEKAGGFVESRTLDTLVLRVPSDGFADIGTLVRSLGRVTQEQVQARDVTRAAYELGLRVANKEKTRDRLLELLERGGELEHVLKLEAELQRVTEEIELLKSQRRNLERDAMFSRITVRLLANAPAPQPVLSRKASPFPWVREVGPQAALRMPMDSELFPALLPHTSVQAPESFVLLGRDLFELRAVDADGAQLWVRSRFVEGADLKFWKKAVEDELRETRGYQVVDIQERSGKDREVVEVTCETRLGGRSVHYLLLFSVHSAPVIGTWVETVELVGEPDGFDARADEVREAYLGAAWAGDTKVASGGAD